MSDASWHVVLRGDATLDPDGYEAVLREMRVGRADVVYADELAPIAGSDTPQVIRKPGWSPRLLLDGDYIGSLFAIRAEVVDALGGSAADLEKDGYALLLRAAEAGYRVAHVPVVASCSKTPWPVLDPATAQAALQRRGIDAEVSVEGSWHRVDVRTPYPHITIVVPTKDRRDLLEACLNTVAQVTTYPSYDVVIVDNGTTDPATLEYLEQTSHRVIRRPGPFNFSWLINEGAALSDSPFVMSLNNDTEIAQPDWLERLVDEMADPTVGAVGCKLVGLDGEAQHEGVALGMAGQIALNVELHGYCGLDAAVRDVCAVTAAVVLLRREAFDAIGGFDLDLPVGYGDVDLCLRLGRAGWRSIYTPRVTVTHVGQASRSVSPHRDDDWEFMTRYPMHLSRQFDPFINERIESFSPYWESVPASAKIR